MSKFELGDWVKPVYPNKLGKIVKIGGSEKENHIYAVHFGDSEMILWFNGGVLTRANAPIERSMRTNEDLEEENRELKKENDKLMEYIRKLLDKL